MDIKYVNPFIQGLFSVLGQFGVTDVVKSKLSKKETLSVTHDITSISGLTGDIGGNIAYCFPEETAKNIVSKMMMGMPVEQLDQMGRSALSEFCNMITGNAIAKFGSDNSPVKATPPSVVIGKDVFMVISNVDTLAIEFSSSIGTIELNIGLEN
jgi:chemotaxis protein CheX